MNQLETCQTYVDHLRAEHRQLHAKVRRIQRDLFERPATPGQVAKALRQFSALGDELRRHFAEEEEGGCMEEAICRCPSVAPEADALLHEHAGLLTAFCRLLARLETEAPSELPSGLRAEFDEFVKDLLAHEAAENKVMQRAFGVTVNGDDEE